MAEASTWEAEGAPGQKEPTPATMASSMSDEGSWNTSVHTANNAAHGWPAPSLDPDNVTGSITPGNPTAAEGAEGPVTYPHAGPPARTTSVGGNRGNSSEPSSY